MNWKRVEVLKLLRYAAEMASCPTPAAGWSKRAAKAERNASIDALPYAPYATNAPFMKPGLP